jgi:hypothetical protein
MYGGLRLGTYLVCIKYLGREFTTIFVRALQGFNLLPLRCKITKNLSVNPIAVANCNTYSTDPQPWQS